MGAEPDRRLPNAIALHLHGHILYRLVRLARWAALDHYLVIRRDSSLQMPSRRPLRTANPRWNKSLCVRSKY